MLSSLFSLFLGDRIQQQCNSGLFEPLLANLRERLYGKRVKQHLSHLPADLDARVCCVQQKPFVDQQAASRERGDSRLNVGGTWIVFLVVVGGVHILKTGGFRLWAGLDLSVAARSHFFPGTYPSLPSSLSHARKQQHRAKRQLHCR